MYLAAHALLTACFLVALGAALTAVMQLRGNRDNALVWVERGQHCMAALLSASCLILAIAFARCDFSLSYVYWHSDRTLPLFYRLTAFWGGQEGSLLFWAWSIALCGSLFPFAASYRQLRPLTKLWYWAFFLTFMTFFFLLIACWSNPFTMLDHRPEDGNGLNPLLQNPGMIFHPPLLFLGYGGFTIPACLSLAQHCSRQKGECTNEPSWILLARPFIITAWLLLSAGIILGAWWSYRELGWGGYWAWDPVENASLIPWLISTACIHTAIVTRRAGKLGRCTMLLMTLTTSTAFFATYIVRSNIVQSLHAFGETQAGLPLLVFILISVIISMTATFSAHKEGYAVILSSREGLLAGTAVVLLTLAGMIALATIWPVFSKLWSTQPLGLTQDFYNKACLPLFAVLAFFLAACPWIGWNGMIKHKTPAVLSAAVFIACAAMLAVNFAVVPLSLLAASTAVAIMAGIVLLFVAKPHLLRIPTTVAAHGAHFGLSLMVLGIAFSGPFKVEERITLSPGQAAHFNGYTIELLHIRSGDAYDHMRGAKSGGHTVDTPDADPAYVYVEAELRVSRTGKPAGILRPQARLYKKTPDRPFMKIDTLFSLGNELYASLQEVDEKGLVFVTISDNPLVNWIWIGAILLCLFPLAGLNRFQQPED